MTFGRPHDEEPAEVLVSGSDRRPLHERIPRRWRRYVPVGAALAAGLLFGGYAGYLWPEPQADGPHGAEALTARIRGPYALTLPYPPYRLHLDLHNAGKAAVTVRDAELRISGYRIVLGPSQRRVIPAGETETILYGVRPDCGRKPAPGNAAARLHIRTPPGDMRTTTLRAAVAGSEVRAGHAILCADPPQEVAVDATTAEVTRRNDRELVMRLDIDAAGATRAGMPAGLRLVRVASDAGGITIEGVPPQDAMRLPATVELGFHVSDCGPARESVHDPTTLRVALVSGRGPYLVYAHTDAHFGVALRRFVAERCGGSA